MTPQELKRNILKAAVFGKVTHGCEWNEKDNPSLFRYIWEVTYWDKNFKDVEKIKQPKVISYSHILARDYNSIEDANGDIFILSTGLYEGYTSREKLSIEPSEGEVISIPGGGSPSVKYWKGKFVTTDNRIATSRNIDILSNKFLFYYLQSQIDYLDSIYRGTGLRHPKMSLVLDMRIPVPSIEEQNKIVCIIDELLPLIEEYRKAEERLTALNTEFPDKLRKSILQQAIQGKLTERDPSDEPASELLKRIRTEKERLIKEGKIKKEKPIPPITEEEMPFEIPASWLWVRLSDVIDVRDGTHDTPKYVNTGYPLITGKDFYNGYFSLEKTQYISEADYYEISKRSEVGIGDILFSMIGGNIGSMIRITEENYFPMAIKNVALFKQYGKNSSMSQYLYCFLASQVEKMKEKAKGGAQPFVPLNLLRSYPFPLPPLAEQQRIVDRVNELLALCDELK